MNVTHVQLLQIDKDVPFGTDICCRLGSAACWNLDSLIRESALYEPHYLAWEMVRKGRNPFFENGTGFEGYFVGLCVAPEDALDRILDTGQHMLTSIARLYRFEPQFRSILIKTLTGEASDSQAMSEWATQLGASLARLRCNLIDNPQADAFQMDTYRLVSALPPIHYRKRDHTIRQCYMLDSCGEIDVARMVVGLSDLKSSEQEAWLVAQLVGKFGHPLVREFIRFSAN